MAELALNRACGVLKQRLARSRFHTCQLFTCFFHPTQQQEGAFCPIQPLEKHNLCAEIKTGAGN
eukprot:1714196-Rhodomonas_salina.3